MLTPQKEDLGKIVVVKYLDHFSDDENKYKRCELEDVGWLAEIGEDYCYINRENTYFDGKPERDDVDKIGILLRNIVSYRVIGIG